MTILTITILTTIPILTTMTTTIPIKFASRPKSNCPLAPKLPLMPLPICRDSPRGHPGCPRSCTFRVTIITTTTIIIIIIIILILISAESNRNGRCAMCWDENGRGRPLRRTVNDPTFWPGNRRHPVSCATRDASNLCRSTRIVLVRLQQQQLACD